VVRRPRGFVVPNKRERDTKRASRKLLRAIENYGTTKNKKNGRGKRGNRL